MKNSSKDRSKNVRFNLSSVRAIRFVEKVIGDVLSKSFVGWSKLGANIVTTIPLTCEHANEVPAICSCDSHCYCKNDGTCILDDASGRRHGG